MPTIENYEYHAKNVQGFEADEIITHQDIMRRFKFDYFGPSGGTFMLGCLGAGLFAGFVLATWCFVFALIPFTLFTSLGFRSYRKAVNEEVNSFNNWHNHQKKLLSRKETLKVLLQIPFAKTLSCGTSIIHHENNYRGTDYQTISGDRSFKIINVDGKLHKISHYDERPDYRWDRTFAIITSTSKEI